MGGIVGRLLNEFAVTIAVAIVVSLVSISLTPMLCSRFLTLPEKRGGAYNVTEKMFDAWRRLSTTLRQSLGSTASMAT
jgi:HAE1 family hydrophobic/amphiphilic exporter-1